ncbi:MAG: hypothetical protein AAFN81_32795 [Bacteroidota bacterium]
MESSIQDFLPEALQGYDPVLVFGVGFGLLLFLIIIIVIFRRSMQRSRLRQRGLVIQSFQIAPLGRDAFLKISNPGPPVTLLHVRLVGRQDVKVKNEVTGQQLATAGNYSVLLEAVGDRRLNSQFQVELSFADAQKVHYQQLFALSPVKSLSIKKKR